MMQSISFGISSAVIFLMSFLMSGIFDFFGRLDMPITSYLFDRLSTRCEPTKPVCPVTSIFRRISYCYDSTYLNKFLLKVCFLIGYEIPKW